MDVGVKPIQVYLPSADEWVWRYTGWFVPFKNEKTCGHRHETEERALTCAQTLLNHVRKDGGGIGGSRGPSHPQEEGTNVHE